MGGLPFTLRQLEVFERLCELRSFRLASEELGISQASVSNQLKALEDQMGLRLLVRESGKRPQLTPEGSAFLADLGRFWESADALAAHRRSGPGGAPAQRSLKVLIGNYLLKDYVRPKLASFFEAHPDILLDLVPPLINDDPRAILVRERFDLALFQENLRNPLSDDIRELARVRSGVFGNRKFLEGRNAPLSPQQVSALPFLLPNTGSFYEGEVLDMLGRHGIKPVEIVGRMQYFDVMSAMFERGTCIGVTIEPLLDPVRHRNTVMLCPLDDWRLAFYRNPRSRGAQVDAAEEFLISSVLDDPAYPVIPGTTG